MRAVSMVALVTVGVFGSGCADSESPADITGDPAVIYLLEASDTVTTARAYRDDGGRWQVRWAPGITCDSLLDERPVGSMAMSVELPSGAQAGDVIDIATPTPRGATDAVVTVWVVEEDVTSGYVFSRGVVVVDAWGSEGGTLRARASVGYVGIDGAIEVLICPE